ncbi:hypothetical protein [Hymenobacter glacieicola]|uniref:Uncharacterized protein n=1 Tax=Hymenobacter glacieicola TaxID=1562124 RepID=A0ABQ1WKQ0_9BACT|nr:hypothetical protein [Hymenobacter glacieicola]GGG35668.1 hypothetical protein GCM10011378_09900 [Hymenobacter glacieicola]
MDSLLSNWGVLSSVVAGAVAVLLYFVKNWRAVEELKISCQKQEQKSEALALKVDEYHVAAVAREAKLREEIKLQAEQVRIEGLQQRAELRKEMTELVLKLTERLANIDKTMALVEERTKVLTEASKEQDSRNKWADRILARLEQK